MKITRMQLRKIILQEVSNLTKGATESEIEIQVNTYCNDNSSPPGWELWYGWAHPDAKKSGNPIMAIKDRFMEMADGGDGGPSGSSDGSSHREAYFSNWNDEDFERVIDRVESCNDEEHEEWDGWNWSGSEEDEWYSDEYETLADRKFADSQMYDQEDMDFDPRYHSSPSHKSHHGY